MEHVIRPATRDDIPQMVKLRADLITYVRRKPVSDADVDAFRNFYENIWDGKQPAYFVCQIADHINGQAAVSVFPALPSARNPTGTCGYIYDVSVVAGERRKGIARALLRRVLEHCKEARVGYVALDATPMGEPLYRSFGFAESTNTFLELWKEGLDKLDA
jgi:GNAT superfamily N-acetyltransferase